MVRFSYHNQEDEVEGTLRLLSSWRIEFRTRTIFREEIHHWYDRSDILDIKANTTGFTVTVVCPSTEDEREEIIHYYYEVGEREVDQWINALTLPSVKAPLQPAPLVIREREVIREIVKIKCTHCGNLFDQKENRCPFCGGR